MKEKYIRIRVDGTIDWVEIDTKYPQRCRDIDKHLNCDCFENVHIGGNKVMLVDDCGKLNGKKANWKASRLYNAPDYIAGDAIICEIGIVNGEHDIIPPSEETIQFVRAKICSYEQLEIILY